MHYAVKYSARIMALIMVTFFGIWFLMGFGLLVWVYFEHSPWLITRDALITTSALGLCSACSGAVYIFLVRKTRPRTPAPPVGTSKA
jgi:hypothetical protein